MARYGVDAICTSPKVEDPTRLYPTVEEMNKMLDIANKWKVKVELVDSVLLTSSLIDREKNPAIMLAKSPERDREIEAFQNHIKHLRRDRHPHPEIQYVHPGRGAAGRSAGPRRHRLQSLELSKRRWPRTRR